ncbi:MAG TPA: TlpA family protein disulfide reductase [Caldithrix abyssi]|uniref:TlpA family protein disulfide reductase n=1 Tax=Caldithrix abyssi TaxID=187145 RepID=A0A7V4TXS2_CALAY|nr:TlpA family protein disulfide reductase [Caldithrix abyssi]
MIMGNTGKTFITYLSLVLFIAGILSAKSLNERYAANFTLKDTSGEEYSLSDFKGKIVILNFWATWCAPCLREMPDLEQINKKYKDQGVQVIGIVVVSKLEDVASTLRKTGVTYPILYGSKKTIAAYDNFYSIPQTFIIGRDGKILKRLSGSNSYSTFEKEIKAVLMNE